MKITDIPFVVLHYTKLTDRFAYLQAAFERMGITPHWITDGDAQTMTPEQISKFYVYDPVEYQKRCWQEHTARRLSPAAISCCIKHILAHQLMLKEQWPFVVTLEDDVRFSPDFEVRFMQMMDALPTDWDVALFGTGPRGTPNPAGLSISTSVVRAPPSTPLSCTDSLMYTRQAIEKLIKTEVPCYMAWDWEADYQIKLNNLITYWATPGLTYQGSFSRDYKSAIQGNTYTE